MFSNCNSLRIDDDNSCSSQILRPMFFAPQRPLLSVTKTISISTTSQFSSSTEQSIQQNQRSIHLLIIVN